MMLNKVNEKIETNLKAPKLKVQKHFFLKVALITGPENYLWLILCGRLILGRKK